MEKFQYGAVIDFSDENVEHQFRWESLIGLDMIKAELDKYYQSFMKAELIGGIARRKGNSILMHGRSGLGKTKLAIGFAQKYSLTMLLPSASKILTGDVAQVNRTISEIFHHTKQVAAEKGLIVVLWDNIEAYARERNSSSSVREQQTTAVFLAELDELYNEEHRVLVIGVTSKPRLLDSSIANRFQVSINFTLPGQFSHKGTLQYYKMKLLKFFPDSDIDLESVVDLFRELSADQIDSVITSALIDHLTGEADAFTSESLRRKIDNLISRQVSELESESLDMRELQNLLEPYYSPKK